MHPQAGTALTAEEKQDESLISRPYIDELARMNQDGVEKARKERKSRRDYIRISCYLHKKFPYARCDVNAIPAKEFPTIARKARNYCLIRTAGASLWSLASTVGLTTSLAYTVIALSANSSMFLIGLGIAGLSATSLVYAIKRIVKFIKILTGNDRYRHY